MWSQVTVDLPRGASPSGHQRLNTVGVGVGRQIVFTEITQPVTKTMNKQIIISPRGGGPVPRVATTYYL